MDKKSQNKKEQKDSMVRIGKKKKSASDKNAPEKKVSQKRSIKKNNSNLGIIVVVAVFIVLIVAAIILVMSNKPKQEEQKFDTIYNGYFFNQTTDLGLWSVVVRTPRGDYPLEFYFHPQQVEMFEYNNNITRDMADIILRQGKFFIGFDTNFSNSGVIAIAGSEVSKITGKVFGIQTKSGFVESLGDKNIPIINCSRANYMNMVLEIRQSDENKIIYDKYCIVLYAKSPEDAVKLADLMDYKLLGVIPGRVHVNETLANISNSTVNETVNSSANLTINSTDNLPVNNSTADILNRSFNRSIIESSNSLSNNP